MLSSASTSSSLYFAEYATPLFTIHVIISYIILQNIVKFINTVQKYAIKCNKNIQIANPPMKVKATIFMRKRSFSQYFSFFSRFSREKVFFGAPVRATICGRGRLRCWRSRCSSAWRPPARGSVGAMLS